MKLFSNFCSCILFIIYRLKNYITYQLRNFFFLSWSYYFQLSLFMFWIITTSFFILFLCIDLFYACSLFHETLIYYKFYLRYCYLQNYNLYALFDGTWLYICIMYRIFKDIILIWLWKRTKMFFILFIYLFFKTKWKYIL